MRDSQIFRRTRPFLMSLALAATLNACGGGYGGGGGGGMGGGSCGGPYGPACPSPTVSVTAPAANANVSGTVALTATASASANYNLTVKNVEFMVDGTNVGSVSSSPYTVMWNSTMVGNGSHTVTAKVTDSMNDTATSSGVTINVQNAAAADSMMTPKEIFPAPRSAASGTAQVRVRLESGAIAARVSLGGMRAIAVTVNEGFAGAVGAAILRLAPSEATAAEWNLAAGARLTAEQMSELEAGRLYVVAASAAFPGGEIRGQLAPGHIAVTFAPLAPASDAEGVAAGATGVIAATLDRNSGTLSVHVNSIGVEDADRAQLEGAGGRLASLAKDDVDMGHWSAELVRLGADDLRGFESGRLTVSVATPVDTRGALRGAIGAPRD